MADKKALNLKPTEIEMEDPATFGRRGSAPEEKQEPLALVSEPLRKTMGFKPKKRQLNHEIEIYKGYGGFEFQNDSDDEKEDDNNQAFNPEADAKAVEQEKPLVTRATTAGVNSWGKTYFFLLKGFMGSGMLTLPMGFCNAGAVFSVICMGVVCYFSISGMATLIEVRTAKGGSYSDMAYEALGYTGKVVCDISLALCQVGHCTVYIIFISQNFSAIADMWGLHVSVEMAVVGTFVVLMPLVIMRDLSKLSPLMIIATLCMFATILTVLFFSCFTLITDGPAGDVVYTVKPDTCLIFIGMGAFLFGKSGVVVPIRDIMQNKKEFKGCLLVSLWSIFGIFAIFGLAGYLAFGRNPKMAAGGGMVTLALNQGNIFVQVTSLAFMLSLIPSFALMIFVPVKIWEKALFGTWPRSAKRTWLKNLGRALAVAGICYLALATARTFDKVMAFFGSFFGGPLTFIWPAIFHLKFIAETPKQKIWNFVLIIFGIGASGFTLYKTILKIMAA